MADRPSLADVVLLSDGDLNFQIFDYTVMIETAEDSLAEYEHTLALADHARQLGVLDETNACRCEEMRELIALLREKITFAKDTLAAMKSEKLRRAQ